VDAAPRARVHIVAGSTRRREASAADRARIDIGRDSRTAIGTREGEGGHRGEPDAADAFRRLLRNEPAARRALVQPDGELFFPWPSADRCRDLVDVSQILDDLEEGTLRRRSGRLRRRRRPRPRLAIATVDAARAAGERGTAVLASVEFERRELAALPTEDSRHRAQTRHDLVEVSRRLQHLMRPTLQHRRNPLWCSGASRCPAITYSPKLARPDNQDRFRPHSMGRRPPREWFK